MMWFGAFLCYIVFGLSGGEDFQTLILAIVLCVVIIVTSTFEIYQEGKQDDVTYSNAGHESTETDAGQ